MMGRLFNAICATSKQQAISALALQRRLQASDKVRELLKKTGEEPRRLPLERAETQDVLWSLFDHRDTVMEWRERINIDLAVCHGQACIKGTRIPVAVVLDNLATGLSVDEIVASYPPLRVEDVRAATDYAAELAGERFV